MRNDTKPAISFAWWQKSFYINFTFSPLGPGSPWKVQQSNVSGYLFLQAGYLLSQDWHQTLETYWMSFQTTLTLQDNSETVFNHACAIICNIKRKSRELNIQ